MLEKIIEIVNLQNKWRREECLNMIASENVMSPLAEKYYISDFESRYNEHDVVSHYQGTKYANEIETTCINIFSNRFDTQYVDVRPISGAVANLCIYRAFMKPGDIFISPGLTAGGHVSSTRYGIAGGLGLKDIPMYFDYKKMRCDVDKTVELIERVKPKVVMFGRSMFLFPEPIKEIKEQIDPKIKVIYDAAHVFGLIYGGEFQRPLEEGADVLTASTHKTFPGPQGGIIIANKELPMDLWKKIQRAVFPGTISNHHIHRLPALAITALEMNEFGKEYAKQTISNAKRLGEALYNLGFRVLAADWGFTESHQIIVDIKAFGGGAVVAEELEKNNIIVNKMALPWDTDYDATHNPSGIRIGTQELTRWGMRENEMEYIAELIYKILKKKQNVKNDVIEMKKKFMEIKYAFSSSKY
ncbi:MAG: serine hydroxymethyltransferase [Candidatus Njordarchaeales archaeon]